VISIVVALFLAALIRSARMPLSAEVNLGLAFEVAASYGIAATEFFDPSSLAVKGSWTGLSWVAVWTAALQGRRANEAAPRVGSRPRLGQRSAVMIGSPYRKK
jgi:hypothetical protein